MKYLVGFKLQDAMQLFVQVMAGTDHKRPFNLIKSTFKINLTSQQSI